jgi:hypothetical protein
MPIQNLNQKEGDDKEPHQRKQVRRSAKLA